MLVKIRRVDNVNEFFHTQNFCMSTVKEFHPNIVSVKIYSDTGKLISTRRNVLKTIKSLLFKIPLVQVEEESLGEEESPNVEPEEKTDSTIIECNK